MQLSSLLLQTTMPKVFPRPEKRYSPEVNPIYQPAMRPLHQRVIHGYVKPEGTAVYKAQFHITSTAKHLH